MYTSPCSSKNEGIQIFWQLNYMYTQENKCKQNVFTICASWCHTFMFRFCTFKIIAAFTEHFSNSGVLWPQMYTRDTRLTIPPHVMASSAMGLSLGVFGFLRTAKANAKQMRSRSSLTARLLTCECLHTQTAKHAG